MRASERETETAFPSICETTLMLPGAASEEDYKEQKRDLLSFLSYVVTCGKRNTPAVALCDGKMVKEKMVKRDRVQDSKRRYSF